MIKFLDLLSYLFVYATNGVFLMILQSLMPFRKFRFMKIVAFLACVSITNSIIYPNDLAGVLGTMIGFFIYQLIFFRGRIIEKISVVLVFYPVVVAINYLHMEIGTQLFFGLNHIPRGENPVWTQELYLNSTAIHTSTTFIRLLFWVGVWMFLRKSLSQITAQLSTKMWLFMDMIMLASFVAIFTSIFFMPPYPYLVFPICAASIFSSFGCIHLISYICDSIKTTYQVQELERQRNYYKDRIKDEERVRRIYHDLKNHLLILQSQAKTNQEAFQSIQILRSQIEGYENYQHTGNEYLDVIIRDKARIAQEKQIDFNAIIHFQENVFMQPLDISTIFGNALDNAIEASEKLSVDRRLITVKTNRVRDMLIIMVENNMDQDIIPKQGTTKADTFLHGFGLSNIKTTVERYEGQCITKAEGGMFTLKMIIPVP